VEDTTYESLREERPAMLYAPFAQFSASAPLPEASLSVRSDRATPAALKQSVASAIAAVDDELILTFRSLPGIIDVSLRQERTLAMLVGFFGLLAMLLSALGIYGVTAYSVTRRRSEIGVRLALGASPISVVRLVLGRLSMLIAAGLVIGVGASLWLSRFVAPLLYGIQANDVLTLLAASLALMAIGILSGWLPARRAARSSPVEALRQQ
jgi:putative ABC transport system permease protein